MYNITFTSVPIMYYALFDFEYDKFSWNDGKASPGQKYFMKNPSLYKIGLDYSCFSLVLFAKYLFYGLIQSIVIFFFAFYCILTNDLQSNGKNIGFWVAGHVAYGACIIVANLVILYRFNNYTGWGEWTCTGMILAFFTILYIESMLSMFP